jgi:hypothetical protein
VADSTDAKTTLDLTASEVATVRQALGLLLNTLGRDDSAEIDEIQALLARLPDAPTATA